MRRREDRGSGAAPPKRSRRADLLIRLLHALLGWNVRQWPFSANLLDGIALCDRPVMDACWDCNERPRREHTRVILVDGISRPEQKRSLDHGDIFGVRMVMRLVCVAVGHLDANDCGAG